jgi:hypothetical protein
VALCLAPNAHSQVTVYDSLSTGAIAGYSELNANNPIFGDSLTLSQPGTLAVFGLSLYNSSSGGNTGNITNGTMLVSFYDNTTPYGGGPITQPLIGQTTLNLDFSGSGGLPPGFYTTGTVDLSALNLALPQNILVTQQFTETSGGSTRNGVVLFNNSTVGSSPNTVYIKSSATAEGLYTFNAPAANSQFGYSISVTPAGGGNLPPVASPQSVTVLENTSAAITLLAHDPDGDPLTYSVVTSPAHGALSGTAPDVIYQPNTGYLGADSFTFKANDGFTDSPPATVSITVAAGAGLIITPVFDSTITSDPNAATIEHTINQAILAYETRFADPINVTITFQEMGTGLGMSSTYGSAIAYSSYYNALTADSKTSNDAVALAHTPGGPNNPVDGTSLIRVTTANQRALGFNTSPPPGQSDSTVSLNVSLMNLNRQTIDPSKYDLMSVVSHEIDEALGTASGLSQANIEPVDLFRYNLGGARTYTTSGDDAYFSMNGGTTDLARYNQDPTGDYGDWWSTGSHTPQVQDAFATPAVTPNLGVELTVLDVIGYDYIVAALPPTIQSVTRSGNNVVLTWNSMAGRTYQVQYRASVSPSLWNNLGSPLGATGPTASVADPILAGQNRFYRIVMLPAAVSNAAHNPSPDNAGPLTLSRHYLWPVPSSVQAQRASRVMPLRLGAVTRLTGSTGEISIPPVAATQQNH